MGKTRDLFKKIGDTKRTFHAKMGTIKDTDCMEDILFLLGPYPFCPLSFPSLHERCIPFVSPIFLNRSLVLPILLFSYISFHCSLRKAFLSLLAIFLNSAFCWCIFPSILCLLLLFYSQLFVRPPQTTILPFCISSSWGWS